MEENHTLFTQTWSIIIPHVKFLRLPFLHISFALITNIYHSYYTILYRLTPKIVLLNILH